MAGLQKTKPIDLRQVLARYNGHWVALIPNTNKVAASGRKVKAVVEAAKKKGVESPVVLKARPAYGPYIG